MIGKDEAEQLEILKAANSEEAVALRQELEDLQKKAKSLEADLEQHKSLLNTALLEKDEVSKKLAIHQDGVIEAERTIAELKSTLAALEGNAEGRDGALEKRVIQLQNKLEDQREKMVKSREHIKKQNAIIKDLKDSSENGATVSRDDDERLKDKEDQIQRLEQRLKDQYETLNGELQLMAAAWWDLSSRMQLNPVAVQRKIEPQNSWLNKQRIAVTRNTGVSP
jgi:protein HOOK3